MSRQHWTPNERDKMQRLVQMAVTGRRLGLSVDECLRAVHTDVLLERGRYDRRLNQYDRMEEAFAARITGRAYRRRHRKE